MQVAQRWPSWQLLGQWPSQHLLAPLPQPPARTGRSTSLCLAWWSAGANPRPSTTRQHPSIRLQPLCITNLRRCTTALHRRWLTVPRPSTTSQGIAKKVDGTIAATGNMVATGIATRDMNGTRIVEVGAIETERRAGSTLALPGTMRPDVSGSGGEFARERPNGHLDQVALVSVLPRSSRLPRHAKTRWGSAWRA